MTLSKTLEKIIERRNFLRVSRQNKTEQDLLTVLVGELTPAGTAAPLTEEQVQAHLAKMLKDVNQTISIVIDNPKRQDQLVQLREEATVLLMYVPRFMNQKEIQNAVHSAIEYLAETRGEVVTMRDMGLVIRMVKDNAEAQSLSVLGEDLAKAVREALA